MTVRDWADMPYVRVYQSIKDDPKFIEVYADDRALAAWLRLLLDADAAWPARLAVPAHLSRHARSVLTKAGLLTVAGGTYSVSGLTKERSSRALTSTERVRRWREKRESERSGVPLDVTPAAVTAVTPRNDEVTPSRAAAGASVSASVVRTSPEDVAGAREAPTPFQEAVAYIETRTRRPWAFTPGSKVWETLEPDLRDFGWPAVKVAMDAEKAPFPDIGQLVFGASRRLHPISGPEKQAELDPDYVKRAVAAQRKPRPNGA